MGSTPGASSFTQQWSIERSPVAHLKKTELVAGHLARQRVLLMVVEDAQGIRVAQELDHGMTRVTAALCGGAR